MKEIRILSATGILGSGFREETLKRAMHLEPHFIGADSGSTDPGPHYLGSGDTLGGQQYGPLVDLEVPI